MEPEYHAAIRSNSDPKDSLELFLCRFMAQLVLSDQRTWPAAQ
jgi:hypothetical protein